MLNELNGFGRFWTESKTFDKQTSGTVTQSYKKAKKRKTKCFVIIKENGIPFYKKNHIFFLLIESFDEKLLNKFFSSVFLCVDPYKLTRITHCSVCVFF